VGELYLHLMFAYKPVMLQSYKNYLESVMHQIFHNSHFLFPGIPGELLPENDSVSL